MVLLRCDWVVLLLLLLLWLLWLSLELNIFLLLSNGRSVQSAGHTVTSSLAVAVEMDRRDNKGNNEQDAIKPLAVNLEGPKLWFVLQFKASKTSSGRQRVSVRIKIRGGSFANHAADITLLSAV